MGNGADDLPSVIALANSFCKMEPDELKKEPHFSNEVLKTLEFLGLSKIAFRNALNYYAHAIPEDILL